VISQKQHNLCFGCSSKDSKKMGKTTSPYTESSVLIFRPFKKYSSRDTIPSGNRNWHQKLGTNKNLAEPQ
jgi:hypothetical protein